MAEEAQKAILDIFYMNGIGESWNCVKMDQALQHRGLLVDQVPVHWLPQGDGRCPSWLDEIEITLMPRQWPVSKEGTKLPEPGFCVISASDDDSRRKDERSPPEPPLKGQPETYASTVPCAPPERITRMDEARIVWLLQESPQKYVLSHRSSDGVEVMSIPRDAWPNQRSLGCLSLFGRPHENGGSVTLGAGVAFDMPQEGGMPLYRCQGL